MEYYPGQRVEALWDPKKEPDEWHGAKVRAIGSDGTLDVQYDDGYHWNGIEMIHVRALGRRDYGTDGVDDAPPNPRARRAPKTHDAPTDEGTAPTTVSTTTPSAVEGEGRGTRPGRKRKAPKGDEERPRRRQRYSAAAIAAMTRFPTKLRALLEEPKHADVVVWRASTQSICVLDKPAFCKILPRYFKLSYKTGAAAADLKKMWDSFVRQLNYYGFHKRTRGADEYAITDDPKITSPRKFSQRKRAQLDRYENDLGLASCWFAFVDGAAFEALADAAGAAPAARACGRLAYGRYDVVRVPEKLMPFADAGPNSRVPKMLGHLFLSHARYLLYMDAKIRLGALEAGQEKGAKFPTSKAPISAVFRSFRLIFGRAIISRSALEAWALFSKRARAEHSR